MEVAPFAAVVNTHSCTGDGAAVVVAFASDGIPAIRVAAPADASKKEEDFRGIINYSYLPMGEN
jgi:hypothetical protein